MLDALIAGFETDAFCGFLRSKFPSFSESRRPLRLDAEFPWDSAEQIGIVKKLTGPNGFNMPLLVVVAALPEGEPLRERSSRLRQFNFARKVLGQVMASPSPGIEGVITQGLFVFHDDDGNFRLSLVFGKAEGTKLVWSTARRLSFHVEAGAGNKTFRDRMALPWASFDKLKEAFSVEKLTKEFYNRLFAWYQWALSDDVNVTYPNDPDQDADDREISEHIIRLITRLMFVWFLKQKHLVPDNLFDPAALSKILKTFSPASGDNYYRAILQNLFFATLNSEIPERAFAVDAGNIPANKEHFGIKTLYRYGGEFAVSQPGILNLFGKIPFLNGGLFECLDKEQSYVDGFSRNPKKQAHVPNRLFFDQDKGLIPLLGQYNFTVEENSPGDEEVALDPELLGKVFENLLGAYNPETKVAARNATGSFYTPREIVNYMVDESLMAHVLHKVGQTFLSAERSNAQTGMSEPPCRMPDTPLAISQRRLPHWQVDGAIYWVTFRLADSIPQETVRAWREERDAWLKQHPEPWDEQVWREHDERFTLRMEKWLDAGTGSRALARPDVRDAVKACLLKFDGERLRLHAAVIMPTHVHCVIEPLDKVGQTFLSAQTESQTGMSASPSPSSALSKLLQGIKGASARAANSILGTSGTFWMDESYDHIVRSETQYRHFERYIEENPTRAKLADHEYWLHKVNKTLVHVQGGADILVCGSESSPSQTGMSASPFVAALFKDGTRPADETLCRQIDDALVTAKILDPACGSGAFPMGILLRMVELLRVLRAIPDDDHDAIYDLKLQLIENCIYGGDIQCIAVQISKLRFFISLVCEQKPTTNAAKNYGIHTLPNLETKFVAADSLIGLPRRGDFLPMQNVETLKKELWAVRHKHFTARSYREKKELRKEDKRLRTALAKELELGGGFDTESARLMAAWDPYDQNTSAPFSDPEWMFNVKDGFDVVIGNPPYVNVELIPSATKVLYKKLYKTFFKRFDLFGLFYEAALLHFAGDRGCVSFIIPQQIANNMSYSKLRDLMLDQSWLRDVLYLGDKVFEAANNDVCVMSLCKAGNEFIRLVYALDSDNKQITVVPSGYFKQYGNVISFGSDLGGEAIFEKIFSVKGWRLKERFKVFQGIVTGNNAAFLPSAEDIKVANLEEDLLKPILLGRDFEKWAVRSDERRILYLNGDTPIDKFPSTKKWLARFRETLETRRECVRGVIPWFSLQWPRVQVELDCVPKLIVQRTRNPRLKTRIVATLDDSGIYGMESVIFIVPQKKGAPIHFLLGVLNSKLINYLYATKFLNVAVKAEYLKDTPIPEASESDQEMATALVKKILAAKKAKPAADTSAWEAEIDRLVYSLYGLTEEEIAIVEASVGEKSAGRGRRSSTSSEATADGEDEKQADDDEESPVAKTKKKPAPRKLKANLPPSLPGWD